MPPGHDYLETARQAELLLLGGQIGPATDAFEKILQRLGEAPSYERTVILERLGCCLLRAGRTGDALERLSQAQQAASGLVQSANVRHLLGTLQSDFGDAFLATGACDEARIAYTKALAIAEELRDLRSQGVDLSQLGALDLAEGRLDAAQEHYQAAVSIFQRILEPDLEAAAREQLGRILRRRGRAAEARDHFEAAVGIREARGMTSAAAQSLQALAQTHQDLGDREAAEAAYRRALASLVNGGDALVAGRLMGRFAEFLSDLPDRRDEARRAAESALLAIQTRAPAAPEAWSVCGILAEIMDHQAWTTEDSRRCAALRSRAEDLRELALRAPAIVATLDGLHDGPSFERAVILERLARCFLVVGRPDFALDHLGQAMKIADTPDGDHDLLNLQYTLQSALGDVHWTAGDLAKAGNAYQSALSAAQESGNLWGQGVVLNQLGALALTSSRPSEAVRHYDDAADRFRLIGESELQATALERSAGALLEQGDKENAEDRLRQATWIRTGNESPEDRLEAAVRSPDTLAASTDNTSGNIEIRILEDQRTEMAFEPNLLIDGQRVHRFVAWAENTGLADDVRLTLVPALRISVDSGGVLRISPSLTPPKCIPRSRCMVMMRLRREVALSGELSLAWRLLACLSEATTKAALLSHVPAARRGQAARILAALVGAGTVDVSGRPFGRLLHQCTEKGVISGGGLEGDEVLNLVTDEAYRSYPGAPVTPLDSTVPEALKEFHALTRLRRSRRDYSGSPLHRAELAAILHTACGVTGVLPWSDRETKLRAYPSSGGLYAVEIYPVALRVQGLPSAVYHYRAAGEVLETVVAELDLDRFITAMLPVERSMVGGAAAMICLAGHFPRHEKKYGQGGYRMLVAEAGHVSQNLILASTALDLSARPFGGVFDDFLNDVLGLKTDREQFLLSVLIGRTGTGTRSVP